MALDKRLYDSVSLAAKTIDYAHAQIHAGDSYCTTHVETVPAGLTSEVRIAAPNTTKWAHMVWSFTVDNDYAIDVYEGTAKTHVGGNVLAANNRDRNNGNSSGLTICHTPGAGADGSVLWQFAGGANKTSTTVTGRREFVLKQNIAYLFRITAAQNDVAHMLFDWYELISIG